MTQPPAEVEPRLGRPMTVLVVDDEPPALDELIFLLGQDPRVGRVVGALSATEALKVLRDEPPDALFTDIAMPGLSGLELAEVLRHFRTPPPIVFVTAHTEHAVDAFTLNAVDYLLKPVSEARLSEAVRRLCDDAAARPEASDSIPVELGGVTRFVERSSILYVEAQGDYSRLHTAEGSHLVRLPIGSLEARWSDAGFLRIHRSLLVSLARVDEVRADGGRATVVVSGHELQVSRRQAPLLRERLRQHLQGRPDPEPGR